MNFVLEADEIKTANPPGLLANYLAVRSETERLCAPLEIEDYGIQTQAFVSPPKWHLAHTAWFFETLILKPYAKNYKIYHPIYAELFNSYYDTIGVYHARPERGLLSRPTVNEVYQYRAYIDEQMAKLLSEANHPYKKDIEFRTSLGLNHEQQHQELLLTDIKHIFAYNPLKPTYQQHTETPTNKFTTQKWIPFSGGVKEIGFNDEGFSYDNECPRHKVYLNDFQIASRLVTNGEYIEFINNKGYEDADLWLSDAWKIINQENWTCPLYWENIGNEWWHMTLSGMRRVDLNVPVCHISFYEAAAYARWIGKRLPTEQEWEIASESVAIKGNFRESQILHPSSAIEDDSLQQMFGDAWEWTQSAYTPYPGYHQQNGPLGEYNGKFMSSQIVLRGGSCVTPENHIRASYRNFFYPQERWQFSGIRLAEDV